MDKPDGMTSDVWFGHNTEDGYEIDYTVFEQVPPEPQEPDREPRPTAALPFLADWNVVPDQDSREPALRIDLDSLTVRHINGVEVRSDSYPVSRSRRVLDRADF
jgi:hypothetical protein